MEEKVNQKNNEKNRPFVLVDKAINTDEDDYIGVNYYVETLVEAINKGASIISINSKYGGGKSSVCNLLKKNTDFKKSSVISLWDVTMEAQKNDEVSIESKTNTKFDVISFYKSFLFQLSADFYNEKYSRYISKALNKTTGLINMFFKTRGVLSLFIISFIFGALYLIFDGVKFINWEFLNDIEDWSNIYFNSNIGKNICLIGAIVFLALSLFKGRVVYTSWKAEKSRLLTIDDVTSLYVGIINDSIKRYNKKKNLIIIDDIDRCIDSNNKEIVINFIKSIVKLLHFDCNNKSLKKKLKSVVLVLCIDESKIITDSKNDEILLKLFDYRLDIGTIHNEDFTGIFDKLIEKIELTEHQKRSLMMLLDSDKNSIRLLKKEINDCILKYNLLSKRFSKETDKINFESCVAYSYLKNNFPILFDKLIKDEINSTINIRRAIEKTNVKGQITFNILSTSENSNELEKFNRKIVDFIKKGYINEEFKLYFYNYPKNEKCKNIYEYSYWNFIKGLEEINIEGNNNLSADYIIECSNTINRISMNYPAEILSDSYILKTLFQYGNDNKLFELLSEKLQLNSELNIIYTKEFIQFLTLNNILYSQSKHILFKLYGIWKNSRILKCNEFYEFRSVLTKYAENNIVEFRSFFQGDFDSIYKEEYYSISDKSIIISLINKLHFNEDLEDILLDILDYIDINTKLEYGKIWSKNINNSSKYVNYTVQTLCEYEKYDQALLNSLVEYIKLIENNNRFKNYLNNLVSNSPTEILKKLNEYNIYFGYSDESIDILLKNDICRTPLILWLYNKMYDKILNCNKEFNSRFRQLLEEKFDYLNENIIDFKKYLLYCSKNEKFDYLFIDDHYLSKYNIEIEWINVLNIHLLIVCNINHNDNIINNISENIVGYNKDNILYLLKTIRNYIPQERYIESNLLIEILKKYPNECIEISKESKIFEEFIREISYSNKYKLAIHYQVICKKLLPEFYNGIQKYNDKDDKEKFAEYINQLSDELLDIKLLQTVSLIYPFRDEIINIYKNNNLHKEVVMAYLARGQLYRANDSINKLTTYDVSALLDATDDVKNELLSNVKFIDKVIEFGYQNYIEDSFILYNIENKDSDSRILRNIMKSLSDNRIIKILKNIKTIPRGNCKFIINLFYDINNIRSIIINNKDIRKQIYDSIDVNYKGSFTKKFK